MTETIGVWRHPRPRAVPLLIVAAVFAGGSGRLGGATLVMAQDFTPNAQVPVVEQQQPGVPMSVPVGRVAPFGFTASLGVRTDLVHSTGLDPFSAGDAVVQSALSVGYRFGRSDRAGVALAFEWNHGSTTASARGAEAALTMDRLSLGLEGRAPLTSRLMAFARLAPALMRLEARFDDASAPAGPFGGTGAAALQQTSWLLAADASAGLALRLGEVGVGVPQQQGSWALGFWLAAEAGYGISAAHELALNTRVEPTPGRTDEPVRLGTLAFRGGFARFRVALSF